MNEKLKKANLGFGPHSDLWLLMKIFINGTEDEKREALRLAKEVMEDFECIDCKFYSPTVGVRDCGKCAMLKISVNSYGMCDGFLRKKG